MRFRSICVLLVCMAVSPWLSLAADDNADGTALKPNVSQPYIVKKGDTLWDIANHFFKDPHRWLQIWERNLYITNPDLIYPGNEIWFDPRAVGPVPEPAKREAAPESAAPASEASPRSRAHKVEKGINHARSMTPEEMRAVGGLTLVRPYPRVIVKEVERVEMDQGSDIELPEMLRRTMIYPEEQEFPSVGHVLDATEPRLNYGANDIVYLRLSITPRVGQRFDIFRQGRRVEDWKTGDSLGVLMHHLGQVQVIESNGQLYKGRILFTYSEVSSGDLLQPAVDVDVHVRPVVSLYNMQGRVIYLQEDTHEVSNNQIVGINLGTRQRLQPGMRFSVYRQGRNVLDQRIGDEIRLPKERIAELIVLSATPRAAMALVTEARSPINLGDMVRPYGR